jgi:hypothetical protein
MKTFSTFEITILKKDIERRDLYAYRQGWANLKKNFWFLILNRTWMAGDGSGFEESGVRSQEMIRQFNRFGWSGEIRYARSYRKFHGPKLVG